MSNLPPVIISSGAPLPPAPRKRSNISLILIAVLGIGTVGFGIASVSAFSRASTATSTLAAAKESAASNAKADQKKADDAAYVSANESPYRAYTSPNEFGGFVINFPKNWNLSVDQEVSSQTQVSLVLEPDFIRTVNSVADLAPAKVKLVQQPIDSYVTRYASNKKITQSAITVAGIAGKQFTGDFGDARTSRVVVIPVRDKIIVFINEDKTYNSTFDTILAQAKINP